MKAPMGWSHGSLGDVISTVRGGYSVKCDDRQAMPDEMAVLKTGAVLNGRLDISQNKYVPPSEHTSLRTPVKAGTIIICRKNSEETIGSSALALTDAPNVFLSDLLWELHPAPNVDRDWLATNLKSDRLRKLIQIAATGTQSTMKNISQDRLLNIPVEIPPLPEQRKIAEILRAWDEAIEKLEALRAAKERRLDTLRNTLLFEGLRVSEVRRNRPMRRIAEVTRELTARNGDGTLGRDLVMGVTNSRGIVPMREQTVAGDIGRYKKLPPMAFAYNPMRINVGSIAMNTGNRTVLVSPDYVVFACEEGGMEPDYLDHLRQTRWWLHHINSGGSGSVRQRTYYDDLAALHLPLPYVGEQRDIVKVLNTAKADVAASADLGEALKSQKRGLMQKLLTGEWRTSLEAH